MASLDNWLGFQQDGLLMITRLIDGPYPNYRQIIRRNNDKIAILDNRALQESLRRLSVIGNAINHRVRFSFGGSTLKFSVDTPDLGEGSDEIDVEYHGDSLDIAFNAMYTLEILRTFAADKIKMSLLAGARHPRSADLIIYDGSRSLVDDPACYPVSPHRTATASPHRSSDPGHQEPS